MLDLRWITDGFADPDGWWGTLAVVVVALVAALVVHRVGVALLRRMFRQSPVAGAVLDRTSAPGGWVLPLFALQATWGLAPAALPGLAVVQHLTGVGLIVAIAWSVAAAVSGIEHGISVARPFQGQDDFGARRLQTQIHMLARAAHVLIVLVAAALVLTTFPAARSLGASLLASAGLAGIVAGFAARPVLGNLIAGLQIGFSQPIRLGDVVIVQNEWGVVEEITGTFVVVRVWDERRLVVPLQWWIENPFQNWTRSSTQLIGTVFLWVDYRMPVELLRAELERICAEAPEWDGRVAVLQVTEAGDRAMQVRALVSAADAGQAWDLRCRVRERLIAFVQRDYPDCLPRARADLRRATASAD